MRLGRAYNESWGTFLGLIHVDVHAINDGRLSKIVVLFACGMALYDNNTQSWMGVDMSEITSCDRARLPTDSVPVDGSGNGIRLQTSYMCVHLHRQRWEKQRYYAACRTLVFG